MTSVFGLTTCTALFLATVCPQTLVTLHASAIEPAGVVRPGKHRWAHGRIPYSFAADLPDPTRARVDSAIARIQARAFGVTFTPRAGETDYVLFRPATDCLSEVEGREEGESIVWLSDTCAVGGVIHELLHVLGFRHEQNRCDRDTYVSIIWSNIEPTKLARHQFEKRCGAVEDLGPYDEASIMHYSDTAFGAKRDFGGALLKTIVSRRGLGPLMGQQDSLSTMDIRMINIMYPPQVTGVAVTYVNGVPTVSWIGARGALSYSVTLVADYTPRTARTRCAGDRFLPDYYYEVSAIFPDGITGPGTRVPANGPARGSLLSECDGSTAPKG